MEIINPKVTILLATYNRAHLICETLDSIINQTYNNWECIIVDDWSTDNTLEVVKRYLKKDKRFNYFLKTSKYRKGLSGTRNQGLDIASDRKAEFIQLFDDDDIMHPRKLELQIEPLLKDNTLGFTTCKYRHYYGDEKLKFDLVDEDCNIFSQNLFEDFYLGILRVNSLGPLWRGDILLKYRFDEELLFAEERDLYLRIFLIENLTLKGIEYVLFYYRKHLLSNTKNRYKDNVKRLSHYKSDLNLYTFIKDNSLWNKFLLIQMIIKFIFIHFDKEVSEELLELIEKDKLDLGFKVKILKLIVLNFLFVRNILIKISRKL